MTTNKPGYIRQYAARLKVRALGIFGNRCAHCHTSEHLEFAHRKPNGLMGRSRGKLARYRNILSNLDCYILLCSEHHYDFDNYESLREVMK